MIDATNVQMEARKPLLALASEYDVPAAAIVLNLADQICLARCKDRLHRNVEPRVIAAQLADLQRSLPNLANEGLRQVCILDSTEAINSLEITISVSPILI